MVHSYSSQHGDERSQQGLESARCKSGSKIKNPGFPFAKPGLGWFQQLSAADLHWLAECGLAQDDFSVGAPNLHLADILHVRGQSDAAVHFVSLDAELLEQVSVALRIHHLPMRVRGSWDFEVVR